MAKVEKVKAKKYSKTIGRAALNMKISIESQNERLATENMRRLRERNVLNHWRRKRVSRGPETWTQLRF